MPEQKTLIGPSLESSINNHDLVKLEEVRFTNKRLSMMSATSSVLVLLAFCFPFGEFSTHYLSFYVFSASLAGAMLIGTYSKRPFFMKLNSVKAAISLLFCAIFLVAIGTFVMAFLSYFALVTGGILADLGLSLFFVLLTISPLIKYQQFKFESDRRIGKAWPKVIGWFIYFFFIGVVSQFSVSIASVMIGLFFIAVPFILTSFIRVWITPKPQANTPAN